MDREILFDCGRLIEKKDLRNHLIDGQLLNDWELQIKSSKTAPLRFADYRPQIILYFLANLASDIQTDLEPKFNIFFQRLFDMERALFIYKHKKKNCYFFETIGGDKLSKEVRFTLSEESGTPTSSDQSMRERILNNSVFRKVIFEITGEHLRDLMVMSVSSEQNLADCRILLVLVNKYGLLGKNQHHVRPIIENPCIKRLPVDILSEDRLLVKEVMKLLVPIMTNFLLGENGLSNLILFGSISETIQRQLYDTNDWLRTTATIVSKCLNVDRVAFYMAGHEHKMLLGIFNEQDEDSGTIKNKIIQIRPPFRRVGLIFRNQQEYFSNGVQKGQFHRKNANEGDFVAFCKNAFCAPICIGNTLFTVFEALNKDRYISEVDKMNLQGVINICQLGFMLHHLRYLK